jgi:hypothetical protein
MTFTPVVRHHRHDELACIEEFVSCGVLRSWPGVFPHAASRLLGRSAAVGPTAAPALLRNHAARL